MKKKNITLKNYVYTILLFAGIILLILYIFSWYNVKKEERLMNSYLVSSKTIEFKINDLKDLDSILTEAPSTYFVLVSYTNDEKMYNLEKLLKRTIDKYKLNDIFYYIDSSNNKDDINYINDLNKSFKLNNIESIPTLIYIEDNKIKEVINNITNDDFKNLLNKYEFEIVK